MSNVVKDFKDNKLSWVYRFSRDGNDYWTLAGQYFYSMHSRCKVGGSMQKKQPTYVGCTTSEDFKDFQHFAGWCQNQIGYGTGGYELDKDLVVLGNREYGEGTCTFIPQELNKFLNTRPAARGKCALGVSFHKRDLVYTSQVRVSGKLVHLGYFNCESSAHRAYKAAKEAEAYRWYTRLTNGEFEVDGRVVERLRTWVLPTHHAPTVQP